MNKNELQNKIRQKQYERYPMLSPSDAKHDHGYFMEYGLGMEHGYSLALPELQALKDEASKRKKEVERIKKHFVSICAENKKKYSDNTAILVFIQKMEESITWVNNL